MTIYRLSSRSLSNLQGVDDLLVAVVKEAIAITQQDFVVLEGLRTRNKQEEYFRRGVSKTLNSKHLTGRAVDLVPFIEGSARWEWEPIYVVATAMRTAAEKCDVRLTWGGVWDRDLSILPNTPAGLRNAVLDYSRRHPGPDFLDGPHYELRE